MQTITTAHAPAAIGPYSQAIKTKHFVFTSGQIALNPTTGTIIGDDVTAQTKQVIENLKAVLEASNSSLAYVVKTTVFLKNITDFPKMNEVYGTYFTHKPARSTVEAARLPKDALVEIEAVAEVL